MANYIISGETLTSIADAIRDKVGTTDTYTPTQMAVVISDSLLGPPTGAVFEHPDVTLDSSGSITIDLSQLTSTDGYTFDSTSYIRAIIGDIPITDSNKSILDPNDACGSFLTINIIPSGMSSTTAFGPLSHQFGLVPNQQIDATFSTTSHTYTIDPFACGYFDTITNIRVFAICH